jgi:hypothetical protein
LQDKIAQLEAKLLDVAADSHGKGQEDGLCTAIRILTGGSEPDPGTTVDALLAEIEQFKPRADELTAHRVRLPELRTGLTRKFKIPRPEKASRADERARIVAWLSRQNSEAAALAARIAQREHGGSPQGQPLKMWVTINTYPDGRPGEIFIKADKSGSLASGALDAVAIALSMAWQHGVPFESTMEKFVGFRFEPNGITGDEAYPIVASALDYIARWALDKFGKKEG